MFKDYARPKFVATLGAERRPCYSINEKRRLEQEFFKKRQAKIIDIVMNESQAATARPAAFSELARFQMQDLALDPLWYRRQDKRIINVHNHVTQDASGSLAIIYGAKHVIYDPGANAWGSDGVVVLCQKGPPPDYALDCSASIAQFLDYFAKVANHDIPSIWFADSSMKRSV